MFGFGKKPEVPQISPEEMKHQELEEVKQNIAKLKAEMEDWHDKVPADRTLLEQLEQKQAQLESEIAGGETKKAA